MFNGSKLAFGCLCLLIGPSETPRSFAQQVASGYRHALLVGVEMPNPDKPELTKVRAKERERDIAEFRQTLEKSFGFQPQEIHELLNEQATTSAVKQAFRDYLIVPSKPGDVAVFLYVGHGTQVVDLSGDEDDGLDEAFCTYDYDWRNPSTWLIDDDLGDLLHQMRTDKVLVINSACHSGTSTRAVENPDPDAPYPLSFNSGFTPKPGAPLVHPQALPELHHVLLAACRADEVSWGGSKGSNFLAALRPALQSVSRDTTFAQLIKQVVPSVQQSAKANAIAQGIHPETSTPQAEGDVDKSLRDYLTPQPAPSRPAPSPSMSPRARWQSQSGDIILNLQTNKEMYQDGDSMIATLTADHDCYVRLYYLSADHTVHQIFPNRYQTDASVKKGETISVPDKNADFEFRMRSPYGNEILMAVASSVPFTDQESERLQDQLFQEFKSTNLEALGQRGIDVTKRDVLTGRALKIYRVSARN